MKKLNANQLRGSKPTKKDLGKIKKSPIYLVLDRIIDTYNIGSLFRLADAIAAEKVYLCGDMEYPPNSRIKKAAIGTEKWVPWEKRDSTLEVIKELKKGRRSGKPLAWRGAQIIVVEQDPKATSYKQLNPKFPCAIVVGNESYGMDKKILEEADVIVELPMLGINKSFNVWGSAAVIAYKVLESLEA